MLAEIFVIGHEEEFVFQDRPGGRSSKLGPAERRNRSSFGIEEILGVEPGITEILEAHPMELIRAGFRGYVDLADCKTVLGRIRRALNLKLLQGIERG